MLRVPRRACPNCAADLVGEVVEVAPAVFVCDRCLSEIPGPSAGRRSAPERLLTGS